LLDDDDDDAELPEGVDLDPVALALALETEPDVDCVDDMDPELVVLTGAPTANEPLWPITSLTLLIWTASIV